jgi:hypothetical protein
MRTADEALRRLAAEMGCPQHASPQHQRQAVENTLRPMIRCAIRTGLGVPMLVRWVRKTLPELTRAQPPGEPVDPDRVTPSLARMLCTTLVQQYQEQAEYPTVASRGELACETVLA